MATSVVPAVAHRFLIARSRVAAWLVAGSFVVMAVRLAAFVDRYAVNILFWDQWDFLQGLFDGTDSWTLFRWQHGPQRQGLGNLLTAVVYNATGWNGRADAAASAAIMAMAGIAGLWLIARLHGKLRPWDVAVPLLFLTTASVETYLSAPNLAHGPLPALFLMAFSLALTVPRHLTRCAALVAVTFFAVNTGFTFLLAPVTIALLLVFAIQPSLTPTDRIGYAAGIAASLAAVALFLHDFELLPAADCFQFPAERPWQYLPFTGFVLARPFGHYAGGAASTLAFGSSVALAMTAFCVFCASRCLRARGESASWNVAFALSAFTMLFASSTAIGRVCLGIESADSSRYIPYVVPGLLAVYLALRDRPPSGRRGVLMALFLTACVVKETSSSTTLEAETIGTRKQEWRECYLSSHDIVSCDARAGHPIYPRPEATHLQQKLDWLESRGLSLFQGAPSRPSAPAEAGW